MESVVPLQRVVWHGDARSMEAPDFQGAVSCALAEPPVRHATLRGANRIAYTTADCSTNSTTHSHTDSAAHADSNARAFAAHGVHAVGRRPVRVPLQGWVLSTLTGARSQVRV